jgi:thioredoxin reductase
MSLVHSLTTNLLPNFFRSIANNLTTTAATMPLVDALIIGAGPAGLSAALALARQLHTGIVFDSSLFRNARSKHMHGIPTWDHKDPADFRGATRAEILERYKTISFEDREVAKIEKTAAGDFAATAVDGTTFTGRRVLLATGVTDLPLNIKGYDECWGRSMLVLSPTPSQLHFVSIELTHTQLPLPLLSRL